jgi:hypothetical protein
MSLSMPLLLGGTTALTRRLRSFVSDISGATTAEFVVIGAAVVGLGMGSVVYVRNGSNEMGANIARTLAKSEIGSMFLVATGLESPPVEETYKLTTLSDGREQRDVFLNGKLVRREISDAAGAHSWATLVTHYDEKGQRVGEDITYDDGRLVEAKFLDGKRTQQRERDLNNVHGWSEIFRLYDKDGRLQSTEVMHNNKTSYSDVYDKDGRVMSRTHRNPEGKVTLMENHAHKVNEKGQLTERTIDYSDGRFLTTDYTEGRATKQKLEDRSDKHNWVEQSWTWNDKGQVDKHTVSYDDKSSWEYNHTEGRITESIRRNSAGAIITTEQRGYDTAGRLTQLTNKDGNGNLVSNEIRAYDSLGRLQSQSTERADGQITTVGYVNGNRISQVIDNPNQIGGWTQQTWQFDETNRTAGYTIDYTNGNQLVRTFIAGRESEQIIRNNAGAIIETATFVYKTDQFDRVTERTISYNDGRQSLTTYDANRPLVQTVTDMENRHSWTTQVTTYDSMHRTQNWTIQYRSGTSLEDVYVEGVRTERIHRDASGNVTRVETF